MLKKIFEFTVWFLVIILIMDMLGWVMWAVSGQMPVDGIYLGTISSHFINLVH